MEPLEDVSPIEDEELRFARKDSWENGDELEVFLSWKWRYRRGEEGSNCGACRYRLDDGRCIRILNAVDGGYVCDRFRFSLVKSLTSL